MERRFAAFVLAAATALPAAAQSLCTSEGQPQPVAVLERFINADCDSCWADAATPAAAANELALDWIVPSARGDDAPLSMGATRDALARLAALKRAAPARTDALRTPRQGGAQRLRIAQGEPVNDYIGTSIEQKPAGGRGWQPWLLLVEQLPAGTEGSPVARNLVRNTFQPAWDEASFQKKGARWYEARPMWIAEGTHRDRLRLVGLLYDARGRLVAATQSHCSER